MPGMEIEQLQRKSVGTLVTDNPATWQLKSGLGFCFVCDSTDCVAVTWDRPLSCVWFEDGYRQLLYVSYHGGP